MTTPATPEVDDSAARRIVLPEGFLGVDAVLRLVTNVAQGLTVNEAVVRAHLSSRLALQKAVTRDPEVAAQIDATEVRALDLVHGMALAIKRAFTDAITRVYLVGIVFALLGLLVASRLPELPLRGGAARQGPPPSE